MACWELEQSLQSLTGNLFPGFICYTDREENEITADCAF